MYTDTMLDAPELPAHLKPFRGRMVVAEAMRRGAMLEARRMKRAGRLEQMRRLVRQAKRWQGQWRVLRGIMTGKTYRGAR